MRTIYYKAKFTDVLYSSVWIAFEVNRDSMMDRMGLELDAIAK